MSKQFKCLVADSCSAEGLKIFDNYDSISYDVKTKHTKEELLAMVSEYDAMIVRSATKVDADVFKAATNLKVVARAGAGYDNIDVNVANEKGVAVLITPAGNTNAVVELSIGMMLAWARNIPKADKSMKEGKWIKKQLKGTELKDKTLGVLGIGRIGTGVAKICQVMGMETIAYDKFVSQEFANQIGVKLYGDLNEFLAKVDYLSLHVPENDSTRGMIGKEQFEIMKDTAVIVNCARGGVINEKELYSALVDNKIAGACIDVYSKEPASKEDFPYVELENVVVSPHLGASSAEAQVNVAKLAAEQIAQLLLNGKYIDCVNQKVLKK